MQNLLRRYLDRLYLTCGCLAAISLLLILLIIMVQMVTRWMGLSLPGLTAYAGYFMGATSFLTLGYALSRGAHIRVTLVLGRLGVYRRFAEVLCIGVSTIISILFSFYAVKTTYWSYILGDISQSQDATPIWIPQISMSIGTVVLSIALLDLLFQALFSSAGQSFTPDPEAAA